MKNTRWVIIGTVGLYTGQSLTRKEAIQEHVEALWPRLVPEDAWKLCRKFGDRAVKATIEWQAE